MRNSKRLIITILSVFIVGVTIVNAATSEPGSSSDPVVSKSYVDEQINQLKLLLQEGNSTQEKSYVDEQINQLKLLLQENNSTQENTSENSISKEEIINSVLSQINNTQNNNNVQNNTTNIGSYVPVSATRGQKIIGGEGTEIILRSGSAVSYTTVEDGIVNATKGLDLKNGEYIGKNNILIVPRNDGRGVSVTSDAWFIIRGSYIIQ